ENLAANSVVSVSVSGTAPPLQRLGNDAGGDQPGQDAPEGSQVSQTVRVAPGRLDVLKWPLIAGFLGIFALGAILLARKPVVAVAGVPALPATAPPAGNSSISAPPVSPASATMAQVDAAVGTSLDALKDQLFRLELRRQAATISEQEYAEERAKAEKTLR